MHRKTDLSGFNIPRDDIECWERYPKHCWVYDLSRLLDSQSISWSPYQTTSLLHRELNIVLNSEEPIIRQPGFIYIEEPSGRNLITEIYIVKGEIKFMQHIDISTGKELDVIIGQLELRLNAFVTLYFQKFTGVISVETYATDIFRVVLRPQRNLQSISNSEITKLLKRIYKKTDITLSGPTDQVLYESLAS